MKYWQCYKSVGRDSPCAPFELRAQPACRGLPGLPKDTRIALQNFVANPAGGGQPQRRSRLPGRSFVRRLNEALHFMNRKMESLASRTPFAALQPRLGSE